MAYDNNKKFEMNKRQIVKTANQKSLMDAIDNMDTVHQTKGTFNKKILLNINNFDPATKHTHKEKQASFYWDFEHVLLIADDIISGRFKDTFYNPKAAGIYSQYGGGQVSRVLNVGFKNGKYAFQVALYKAIKTRTGAIMPDKNNPIDNHSIQVGEFETRLFMMNLKAHIEAKLAAMALIEMKGTETYKQPEKSQNEPVMDEYNHNTNNDFQTQWDNSTPAPIKEEQKDEVQDINDFLNNI